jgi:hypothetical protein
MSKRIVKGKPEYIMKQLLNVANKILLFKFTEETIKDHIGIMYSSKSNKIEFYPLSYEGDEILDCYLGSPALF